MSNRVHEFITPLLLSVNHIPLHFETYIKFLGIKLDNKLNFSSHISHICSKLSKTTGILYRICKFVPLNVLIKLYYSLVYPYILYGVVIWGDSSDVYLNSILLIQKKIIRIITSSEFLSPTAPLFYSTKILHVKDVYRYNLGIFMFKKHLSGDIPLPMHSYNTRNINSAIPNFQRLSQCQRSIDYNGPKYWNNIPQNIQNSPNIRIFKLKYKEYLLSAY